LLPTLATIREQKKNIILPQCLASIAASTVGHHEFDLVLFCFTRGRGAAEAGKPGNSRDLLWFPIDPHISP
jgi:hypothetical protein